jgi:hypothetical protein
MKGEPYRILARNLEEFDILRDYYKDFSRNFSLETEGELLIHLVHGKGAIIGISPLSEGEIKSVKQTNFSSGWDLRASDGDAWFISGKDNDYIVYKKKLESLV